MRKSVLMFAFVFVSCLASNSVFAQSKSVKAFYESQKDKDHDVCVTISGSFLKFLSRLDIDDDDIDVDSKKLRKAVDKINDLMILSIDKSRINRSVILSLQKAVNKEGYEDYLIVREGKKLTKFMAKEKGNKIVSLILVAEGDENYTVLEFNGEIDPESLSNMSDDYDIKGLDDMKKVKKKK
jgi:hypothetical protein